MADKKISALTGATTPLAGTEILPIVQAGVTVQVAVSNLTAGRAVSAASVNKVVITAPATASTLTIADGKTLVVNDNATLGTGGITLSNSGGFTAAASKVLTASNSMTLAGTDATTHTFPTTSSSVARTDAGQTFTGINTFTSPKIITDISDINGNELFKVTATASAVNEITIANAAIGNNPVLSATGSDTNIGITLTPKGTGNLTLTLGNLVPATAAKGINFTANTPAAGMTSQLLNWYEEGTWTPNQGAGLTVVGAFSSSGTYTCVGRQVTVRGQVVGATSVATTTAGVISSNLPFTAAVTHAGSMFNDAVNASGVVQITAASVVAADVIAATPNITFTATFTV
jgi:hypothetical protein